MVHEEEEEEEEELIVHSCQSYVCFELPSVMWKKTEKFRNNYNEYYYTCYDI